MPKNYTLSVFNTVTSQYEDISVTEAVYNEYRRSCWREEKSDAKHRKNETPFSSLIGGENHAFENFHEFLSDEFNPETLVSDAIQREALQKALSELSSAEQEMLKALYADGLSEREYASITGIPQKTINNRKLAILRKLRKLPDFQK